MINPVLVDEEGCQTGLEGCLSLPEVTGKVTRPEKVKVEFMDMDGQMQVLEGEGMLARAICHEIDHLNGILFTDRVEEDDEEYEEYEEYEEEIEEMVILEEVEE